MIVVKLMGGLGNQMFQYATGLRLAHKRGASLRLDVTGYDNMHKDDTPREYDLDCYKISSKVASASELGLMLPQDFRAGFSHKIMRRAGFDKRLRPLGEESNGFNKAVLSARDNTYLIGWWQNERYFKDIHKILVKEFVPKKLSAYCLKLAQEIKDSKALSIHVRRGDYVSNKFANKEHGVLPIEYYTRAIKYVANKNPSLKIYVFSDDIAWCKKNLKLPKDTVYVSETKQACEDIYLMSLCQHNIIANSSFSWWGAWLNTNKEKIVVAPKKWFQNPESNRRTEIVPETWVRL